MQHDSFHVWLSIVLGSLHTVILLGLLREKKHRKFNTSAAVGPKLFGISCTGRHGIWGFGACNGRLQDP